MEKQERTKKEAIKAGEYYIRLDALCVVLEYVAQADDRMTMPIGLMCDTIKSVIHAAKLGDTLISMLGIHENVETYIPEEDVETFQELANEFVARTEQDVVPMKWN